MRSDLLGAVQACGSLVHLLAPGESCKPCDPVRDQAFLASLRMMFSPAYFTPLPLYGSGGRKPRILAATSPTRCLSAPVTPTSVWVGVLIVIPSGVLNSTGCEKHSARDRTGRVVGPGVYVRVDLV